MPLTPDKIMRVNYNNGETLIIKQKIIPDNAKAKKNCAKWCKRGQSMKPNLDLASQGRARGITVHNTTPIKAINTSMSEQYTRATWPNCNMGGVVVHFYVSPEEVWQNLDLTEQGWHASDGDSRTSAHDNASYKTIGGNVDCIAVEIIGKESEDNGAKLIAYLLWQLDLKIEDVYTHNYFINYAVYGRKPEDKFIPNSYKNCPLYILNHWDLFLDKVEKYLALLPLKGTATTDKTEGTANSGQSIEKPLFRTQIGAFHLLDNAREYLKAAKKAGYTDSYITSVLVHNEKLYRVQIGAFSTFEAADTYGRKAKADGFDYIVKKA